MRSFMDKMAHATDVVVMRLGDFCGLLVIVMAFLIAFEVFMRYVVGQPPLLADELSRYMLVAMTFLGVSYVWKEKGHVRVEAIVARLSRQKANRLRLVTLTIAFVLAVALFAGSLDFIARSFSQNRTSDSWMHMPLKWPESTIVVGFLLLAAQIGTSIWRAIGIVKSGGALEEEPPR